MGCRLPIFLLLVLACEGCALPGREVPNKDEPCLSLYNGSSGPVIAEMEWTEPDGRNRSLGAMMGPRTVSIPLGVKTLPETVSLTWKTPDGIEHAQKIPIASRVPNAAKFKGGVVVRIFNGDEIKLSWLTYAEYEWGKNPQLD